MNRRLISIVSEGSSAPTVKHYRGVPPELTGGNDTRQEMERATFITIEGKPEGAFLFRFASDGTCVGDTWHMNVDDAKRQAAFEYDGLLRGWIDIPQDVGDSVMFGLDLVKADE